MFIDILFTIEWAYIYIHEIISSVSSQISINPSFVRSFSRISSSYSFSSSSLPIDSFLIRITRNCRLLVFGWRMKKWQARSLRSVQLSSAFQRCKSHWGYICVVAFDSAFFQDDISLVDEKMISQTLEAYMLLTSELLLLFSFLLLFQIQLTGCLCGHNPSFILVWHSLIRRNVWRRDIFDNICWKLFAAKPTARATWCLLNCATISSDPYFIEN